jgi:hypothetical protein
VRNTNCRGEHTFGSAGSVGGGLTRRSCGVCGTVVIDLRSEVGDGDSSLFLRPKLDSIFVTPVNRAESASVQGQMHTFGRRPDRRRRVAQRALA